EVPHLAAPVHLVTGGVEGRDLRHRGGSRQDRRPEALPADPNRRDDAHTRHDHPRHALAAHEGRCSRCVSSPPRSAAANVSFALTTVWPSTSATPRTMAAVEITFSATSSKSS